MSEGEAKAVQNDFNDRLRQIHESIGEVIERLRPDQLAIERVFVARNAASALKLGAARSAAICASFAHALPIHEYTPREVKLAITGRGAADKGQIQHMVKALLSLKGDLQADAADALAIAMCHGIDVHGMGYEVETPMSTFYELPGIGDEVTLLTHFLVREDAQQLYGFATEQERSLFRNLLRVSGVGARIALAILSGTTVDGFRRCIEFEDVQSLVKVPGIGRKTAERLIVEMRDRLGDSATVAAASAGRAAPVAAADPKSEAFHALLALGYRDAEVRKLLAKVEPGGDAPTAEDYIRQALKQAAG